MADDKDPRNRNRAAGGSGPRRGGRPPAGRAKSGGSAGGGDKGGDRRGRRGPDGGSPAARKGSGVRPGGRSGPDRNGGRPGASGERAGKRDRPGGDARRAEPRVPDDIELAEVSAQLRRELRTLPRELAERVAGHLAAAEQLSATDPEAAYEHAQAAVRRGGRLAVVREIAGVTAYAAGRWADAARELRAARRLGAGDEVLPLIADCERGLGRPERALSLATSQEAAVLSGAGRIEMLIVGAGARRDLGQADAAVVLLQVPELRSRTKEPWQRRLRYAYADALADAGRTDEAARWFARVAAADTGRETDAAVRLAALRGESAPAEPPAGDDDGTGIVDLGASS